MWAINGRGAIPDGIFISGLESIAESCGRLRGLDNNHNEFPCKDPLRAP
jgi:hypothetical protein